MSPEIDNCHMEQSLNIILLIYKKMFFFTSHMRKNKSTMQYIDLQMNEMSYRRTHLYLACTVRQNLALHQIGLAGLARPA